MAESDLHRDLMVDLIASLKYHFRADPQVYTSGNLFVYYEEGNPSVVVAPDVFVVRGVPARRRKTYKVWDEGKGPDLVIELTSKSTHLEDLGNKRAIYEALGVKEYYIFDPEGIGFEPRFRGFVLEGGDLHMVSPRQTPDGRSFFTSHVVELDLRQDGNWLRFIDPATGQSIPCPEDLADAVREALEQADAERQRADAERQRADAERQRADAERQRADAERQRADAAELECGRLREEISRLRSRPGG
jgi:Uma2 family endonuclease